MNYISQLEPVLERMAEKLRARLGDGYQSDIAKATGLRFHVVRTILAGQKVHSVKFSEIAAIALALNISLDELVERDKLHKPYIVPAKRRCVYEYQGKSQGLSAWAREIGISRACLLERFRRGWTVEEALSTPLHSTPEERTDE